MPSRTRSKNDIGPTGSVSFTLGGAPNGTYSHVLMSDARTMTDTVTPKFDEAIGHGEIVNNSCLFQRNLVRRGSGGRYYAVRKSNGQVSQGTGSGCLTAAYVQAGVSCSTPSFAISGEADKIAAVKLQALSKIDQAPYGIGQDVAEIRQTLEFMRDPLKNFDLLTRNISKDIALRMPKKSLSARAKALSGLWADYRFAIGPNVRTLDTLLHSLIDGEQPRPKRQTAHAYAKLETSMADKVTATGNTQFRFTRSGKREVEYHASVLYEISNPVKDWKYKYGLRNKDIMATMWEVYPYSFVVDRAFNVGGALKGLLALSDPSVTILAASLTKRDETLYRRSMVEQINAAWDISITPDDQWFQTFVYDRSTWIPTASDTIPRVNLGGLTADITKTVDLISLCLLRMRDT